MSTFVQCEVLDGADHDEVHELDAIAELEARTGPDVEDETAAEVDVVTQRPTGVGQVAQVNAPLHAEAFADGATPEPDPAGQAASPTYAGGFLRSLPPPPEPSLAPWVRVGVPAQQRDAEVERGHRVASSCSHSASVAVC
ncbi:MAG: hypothetical protein Q8R60_11080 [Mycobacteriales bacterium]|nr:hypothetical protein [Mycobacteriales bacterium]